MKAITIWQPWATLRACGAKEFETRGWATAYRGPVAIHAAQINPFKVIRDIPLDVTIKMRKALKEKGILTPSTDFRELPRGAVIATAELVGCHEIVRHGGRGMPSDAPGWLETDRGIYEPTDQELLFGNWTPGRYAWEFANVKMLSKPIPVKGKQRLWNWEGA
jgi:hypothetical protein